MTEIWPNFFVVGAIRSGTTSLYEYLRPIESIFLPSIKEPNYFSISIKHELLTTPIRDTKKYLKLFQGVTDETAIGESSPTYLWDPKAAKLIHQTVPDAKIIMILRNPVERSFSHYLMLIGNGSIEGSFEDNIKKANKLDTSNFDGRIINASFYYEQVKRYLELFPKEQLKIFIFEEFIKDTKKSVQDVLDFLEVDSPIPDNIQIVDNTFDLPVGNFSKYFIRNRILRSVVRELFPNDSARNFRKLFRKSAKKPPMTDSEREFGEKLYFEDSKKLENLLNISLPWTFLNKK